MKPQKKKNSKGVYKAALFYEERTVTVHNVLFLKRVSPGNVLTGLIVVHMHFDTFCALCTVKANERKKWQVKTFDKDTGGAHKQFTLY